MHSSLSTGYIWVWNDQKVLGNISWGKKKNSQKTHYLIGWSPVEHHLLKHVHMAFSITVIFRLHYGSSFLTNLTALWFNLSCSAYYLIFFTFHAASALWVLQPLQCVEQRHKSSGQNETSIERFQNKLLKAIWRCERSWHEGDDLLI